MPLIGWRDLRRALWAAVTPVVRGALIPTPFIMVLVVTRRCNSRCQMCNIWRTGPSNELSLHEMERIVTSGEFARSIRVATLTGGEPILRKDLPNIVGLILASCPQLEHLTLATNGLNPQLTIQQVSQCADQISRTGVQLGKMVVQVSLDGIGEVHDKVRGIPGAYERVLETCESLLDMADVFPKVRLALSCVVQRDNVAHLRDIQRLAGSMGVPVLFNPLIFSPDYYDNLNQRENVSLNEDQASQAGAFFEELASSELSSWRFYYRDISKMLSGATRGRKCMMGVFGFVLETDGEVHPCMNCESARFGNLRELGFRRLWFDQGSQAIRRYVRQSCCPTCSSSCYALPVNAFEVGVLLLERLRARRPRAPSA